MPDTSDSAILELCQHKCGGLLYEAWWSEGHMLQRGRFEARRAPFQIIGVAISLLQVPVHCAQLEVICPVRRPAHMLLLSLLQQQLELHHLLASCI